MIKNLKGLMLLTLVTSSIQSTTATQSQATKLPTATVNTHTIPHHETSKKYNVYLNALLTPLNNGDRYDPFSTCGAYYFVNFEYYPIHELSIGVELDYQVFRTRYKNTNRVFNQKFIGGSPYFSYLFTPKWIVSGQIGYYAEPQEYREGNAAILRGDTMASDWLGMIALTWLGEEGKISTSVRGTYMTQHQYVKTYFMNNGTQRPPAHFDQGTFYGSARFKYKDSKEWDAYMQVGLYYSPKATYRPSRWRGTTSELRSKFEVGPAIHWNFAKEWQLKGYYLYNWGFGLSREHALGVRLKLGI